MAPYNPPIKHPTRQIPLLALIGRVDPEFQRDKRREAEYVTSSGRVFRGDPTIRGPYNDHDNTFTVGQPFGADDAAKVAAKAATVGNEVLGLYEGVATDGWA